MIPSSTLCRAREDFHRRAAAGSLLENVRRVANIAAAAWAKEAEAAECREERHRRGRTVIAAAAIPASSLLDPGDRTLSENPDRGRAS